jgi:hypothetical protein
MIAGEIYVTGGFDVDKSSVDPMHEDGRSSRSETGSVDRIRDSMIVCAALTGTIIFLVIQYTAPGRRRCTL